MFLEKKQFSLFMTDEINFHFQLKSVYYMISLYEAILTL